MVVSASVTSATSFWFGSRIIVTAVAIELADQLADRRRRLPTTAAPDL